MKRYDVERGAKWIEKINGMFVLREDVAALRASHTALVEALEKSLGLVGVPDWSWGRR